MPVVKGCGAYSVRLHASVTKLKLGFRCGKMSSRQIREIVEGDNGKRDRPYLFPPQSSRGTQKRRNTPPTRSGTRCIPNLLAPMSAASRQPAR